MPVITPTNVLLFAAAVGAALFAAGLWAERRVRDPRPASVIRPIEPPAVAAPRRSPFQRIRQAILNHPDPLVAIFKTAFWLAMAVALVDHLRDVQHGTVAYLVWLLTIGPHEIGHYLCWPFGWVLNVAGGSIWQVLLYVLLALYTFTFRRQVWLSLVFWMIAGHSLINLSVYIGDAAERDLPLILGMDKSRHDWWNLLGHYNALQHDDLIAALVRDAGVVVALAAMITGLITAWWIPRRWTDAPTGLLPRHVRRLDALRPRRHDR